MRKESTTRGDVPDSIEASKCDVKCITAINRWLLMPIGIWPNQSDTHAITKVISELVIIICYCLIFLLLIPCALHNFLTVKSPRQRMKMMGPMSFCVMTILKYSFLVTRRKNIQGCLNHIDGDCRMLRNSEDREIMLNHAKNGHFIASLCATFMYSGAFFYRTILPFTVPRKILPDNTTLRPLAYPVYRPLMNSQKTPTYELVFTAQWFGGIVIYTISVATCSLAAVFVLHACGQLQIVVTRLEAFVESSRKASQALTDKLAEIVELHLRAMHFVIRIEELLNEICFVEFIGCTINICFIGYYFISDENLSLIPVITYSFLIISFTFNIFIYCHVGELLNQQGKKVGTTTYMINWYQLPVKITRDLTLVLAIANCPTTITAGKMVELSYATFCNVLKSAMAYFNLLRSLIL